MQGDDMVDHPLQQIASLPDLGRAPGRHRRKQGGKAAPARRPVAGSGPDVGVQAHVGAFVERADEEAIRRGHAHLLPLLRERERTHHAREHESRVRFASDIRYRHHAIALHAARHRVRPDRVRREAAQHEIGHGEVELEFAQPVLCAHGGEIQEEAFAFTHGAHVRFESEPHELRRDLAFEQPHQIAAIARAAELIDGARDDVGNFSASFFGEEAWGAVQIELRAAMRDTWIDKHAGFSRIHGRRRAAPAEQAG
ncbi:protein of unknown function [Paraburkholderia kururiensis]